MRMDTRITPAMRQRPTPRTATGLEDVLAATLSDPAAAGAPPAGLPVDPSGQLPGQKVGPIRIHKLLGEGGMGAVYSGYDERLQREVALKAVRFDSLTPNGRARLLSEARILSRLNHPNICAIHDFVAGETTDFLVLELIQGTTLREAIAQGTERTDRIGIAERIAEALVAAHAQGIIHRDLKPSNVMLTREGRVKVLDFGIARLGEGGGGAPAAGADPDGTTVFTVEPDDFFFARTTPGKVIGTAGCMSPEQARGEPVTVASDMYSFGLLLQELFTGKPPYAPALSGVKLLLEVQKGRTLPVSGLDGHLTALIERLKSLAPEDRPSAAEVLQRLRWIADRPRQRRRALGAGVALLMVALGLAKYTLDLRRERDAAVRAERRAEVSRRQGDEVVGFLLDLFKVSDPGEARGSSVTARELLDQGARKVRDNLRGQPLIEARLLDTIGQVYLKLGLYGEAGPLLEDALALRRQHPATDLDLATSLEHLAQLDLAENKPQAEGLYRQALRLREAKLGHGHPEVAKLLNDLGVLHAMHRDWAQAETLLQEALKIREATLGPLHPDVVATLNNLGMVRSSRGDVAGAEALLLRGLAIREQVLPAGHPDLAANLEALGVLYQNDNRFAQAERYHRRALAITEKVLAPDHPRTALILTNLAETLIGMGKENGEVEALLRRAVRAREARLGPDHPEVGISLADLASLYRDQKRYAEAEPLYRRALAIFEAAYPHGHPNLKATLRSYARLLRATGRPAAAAELETRAKKT
jgi:tetratricopeptide (TPR) repeat protein